MNNSSSIKEARLEKGLSIEDLAHRLKISPFIIKKIENNEELPKKYKSYERIFRNSILKLLGLYKISGEVKLKEIPEDNTKFVLSIFLLILIFTILISLSFDMYKKFNFKSNLKFFEKDQIYIDIENKLSDFSYDEIDHEHFLNKLILLKNNNFHNFFEISVLDNNTIYYMVSNNTQKTQKFGAITWDNPLYLYFNDDFSIDLSNINLIDKIVVNNSIYQIDVNKPYALKDFNLYNFIDPK